MARIVELEYITLFYLSDDFVSDSKKEVTVKEAGCQGNVKNDKNLS